MTGRTTRSIGAAVLAAAALAAGGVHIAAQRRAAAPAPVRIQGPNISGSWERYGNFFGPPPAGRANDPTIPPRSSPPPLKHPYLEEWQARVKAAREADAKGQPLATNYTNCLPDGMPTMMQAMFPIEFLQSPGQVTVIEEAFTQVRRVLLDRPQKPLDEIDPSFYGHSVGHWDGDTLVVDTIGVKEDVRYQNAPHSPELRIAERIHLVAKDILWDEITMDDPVTLEKPWTVVYAYKRMPEYTLLEYVCEDNREYADETGHQRTRLGQPPQK